MEEILKIKGLCWYPRSTAAQVEQWKKELVEQDRDTLLLLPDPTADTGRYQGILLSKYYTEQLSACLGVQSTSHEPPFTVLSVSGLSVRGFVSSVMRRLRPYSSAPISSDRVTEEFVTLPRKLEKPAAEMPEEKSEENGVARFLQTQTPAAIQKQLEEYVIGQPELTRSVADFLYYHALRQIHPQLPQRPLMITGPSGSGKTEVWRVARRLYGDLFPIRIMDGSSLSCEGWSGNYKLDTYMDAAIAGGGILVVDEFDKLTKPRHASGGDNVSLDIQAEFLKLLEGEYRITENRKRTNMTSQKMGFVLVGAFESLRARKRDQTELQPKQIGFCTHPVRQKVTETLTDEDFIAYGIMPEIVGRIAVKCQARHLSDSVYMDIVKGPNSRVAQLSEVLRSYGVAVADVISAQSLSELISASRANHTGVRWVSAQVESRLLEAIYDRGVYKASEIA